MCPVCVLCTRVYHGGQSRTILNLINKSFLYIKDNCGLSRTMMNLRYRPFTAKTGVRFPLGAPRISIDYRQPSRLIERGAQHLPDKRSRTSTNLAAVRVHGSSPCAPTVTINELEPMRPYRSFTSGPVADPLGPIPALVDRSHKAYIPRSNS
jgi:hypothetical protein